MQFCGIRIAIVCPPFPASCIRNISPRFYLSRWLSSHHLAALISRQNNSRGYLSAGRNDDRRFGNTSGRISTVLTIRIWGEFTRKEEEEEEGGEGGGGFIRAINRKDPRMALWRFPHYITALSINASAVAQYPNFVDHRKAYGLRITEICFYFHLYRTLVVTRRLDGAPSLRASSMQLHG